MRRFHRAIPLLAALCGAAAACSSDTGGYYFDYGTEPPDDRAAGDPAADTPYDPPPAEQVDTLGLDRDGDGYTPGEGDCDDTNALINPGAYDHPGNFVNDDCAGGLDDPPAGCDCGTDDLVAGMDICDRRFVVAANEVSYTSRSRAQGAGVRTSYGNPTNGLGVKAGCGYSIIATGAVDLASSDDGRQIGTDFYGDPLWDPCMGGEPDPNPAGPSPDAYICDTHQLFIHFKAPPNANGFSFDFVYLSAEYPEWVNEGYNDTFYAILRDYLTGNVQNISYDNFTHEIEVDNAFFESPPVTDISGTGYDIQCENEIGPPRSVCGSSTGWLRTSWNVEPGQEFDLTFSIHDEGDGIYDSAVILDNFQWSALPVDPGTIPI